MILPFMAKPLMNVWRIEIESYNGVKKST
jgi:hypothetical protein